MKDLPANLLDDLLPLPHGPDGPGCATAVIKDGKVAALLCKGMASVEHQVPITPQTVFRVASITKQFLCAGLIALADQGKLDLDAPLADFVDLKPGPGRVTLRQAMSNTSGIRDHLELWFMAGGGLQNPHRLSSSLELCARQEETNFPPGTRFLYSNANFFLLSHVAETVAGQPLGDFLKARFFDPLGMTRTLLRGGHFDVVPGLATGYVVNDDGALKRGRITTELWGEGSAHSCLDDLVKWVNYYRSDPHGIIAQMRIPMPVGTGVAPYGLGLFAEHYDGADNIVHTGLWPGYLTELLYRPKDDLGLVTLANVNSIEPTLINRDLLARLICSSQSAEPSKRFTASWRAAVKAGLWVEPETLDTAAFKDGPNSEYMLEAYGFSAALQPVTDARLVPRHPRSDYAGIDMSEAASGVIKLELVNGGSLSLVPARHRYQKVNLSKFEGTWWCDDLQASLIIERSDSGLKVETPQFRGHDWICSVASESIVQLEVKNGPWPRKFLLFLQENGNELIVNGPRVRRLTYVRR